MHDNIQILLTIDKKHQSCFLCNIVSIRSKTIHLEDWARRIIIWSFYFHQITSNRCTINGSDCIQPWTSPNCVNICSIRTVLNQVDPKYDNKLIFLQQCLKVFFKINFNCTEPKECTDLKIPIGKKILQTKTFQLQKWQYQVLRNQPFCKRSSHLHCELQIGKSYPIF